MQVVEAEEASVLNTDADSDPRFDHLLLIPRFPRLEGSKIRGSVLPQPCYSAQNVQQNIIIHAVLEMEGIPRHMVCKVSRNMTAVILVGRASELMGYRVRIPVFVCR